MQKFNVMQKINRLRRVLVMKGHTNLWLSKQLGVDPTTVSKWCTNSSQPDILTILKISQLLNIGIKEFYDEKIVGRYNVWQE